MGYDLHRRHQVNLARREGWLGLAIFLLGLALLLVLFTGCSHFRGAFGRAQKKAEVAQGRVNEDTKKSAKAAVDALALGRTGLPRDMIPIVRHALEVAAKYAEMTERGVGLPAYPIDVEAEVRGDQKAVEAAKKFESSSNLNVATRDALAEAELARLKALAELGAKYEKEHNQNIVSRVWHWSLATFGVGGLIALCIFFPAIIPILGRILGWVVAKIPKLAGLIGVVATKAYDKVVGSNEIAMRQNPVVEHVVKDVGSRKMDDDEKYLVEVRKPVALQKFAEDDKRKAEAQAKVHAIIQETELIKKNGNA